MMLSKYAGLETLYPFHEALNFVYKSNLEIPFTREVYLAGGMVASEKKSMEHWLRY